jgi:hypothetical protein
MAYNGSSIYDVAEGYVPKGEDRSNEAYIRLLYALSASEDEVASATEES